MEENTNDLISRLKNLFDQKKFDEIIASLTDEMLSNMEAIQRDVATDLYVRKGTALYNKQEYDDAIMYYKQAMRINSKYELAYYNRGLANIAKGEYLIAIKDFDTVIKLNLNYVEAYISRGSIRRFLDEYDLSIADFNEAIKRDSENANAYYNRGLTYYNKALKGKEINIDLIKDSKKDFEKHIKLNTDEKDNGAKYAKLYIEELKVVIEDPNLWSIKQLINTIKNLLWIRDENCITHYTSLSVLKDLIFDNSKFRISEGNFMNDPSEGDEFFDFLEYKHDTFQKDNLSTESISPKPFIGSFVTNDKCNNLNMWRFYGKEKGEEAKGCAITLHKQKFIDDINDSLSNEKNKEARMDDESNINFYRVVYVTHNEDIKFYVPGSNKSEELEKLMNELKTKVEPYKKYESQKGENKVFLEKYLNSIAFLFKNDAYKNEDEVRLVMNGVEFDKKYNMGVSSPRVYIELVPIKDIVSQIILGPKVDKGSEWMSAFYYRYENSAPEIKFSHLPYK